MTEHATKSRWPQLPLPHVPLPEPAAVPGATVLYVDCPWKFGDALPGPGRGAKKHYQCMTVDALCEYKLPRLADDCLLAFWRCASMQNEALRVIDAWGFVVKSELVWLKMTRNGKRHFGMGRYVRASHEVCLLATRGRVHVADRSIRSVFEAPVQEHSRKPDIVYELLERLVPAGPYVELFARRHRYGWTSYGNELSIAQVCV